MALPEKVRPDLSTATFKTRQSNSLTMKLASENHADLSALISTDNQSSSSLMTLATAAISAAAGESFEKPHLPSTKPATTSASEASAADRTASLLD